jgi:PAS domain-containing protein
VHRLGGAIRETLNRNYVSIDVGQRQHAALRTLELAERDGTAQQALPAARATFAHWMAIEYRNRTEPGEPELAQDIDARWRKLSDEIATDPPGARHDREFDELHARLDALIALNKAAIFRADSRATQAARYLTYALAAGFAMLLLVAAAFSIWLTLALSRPLSELAERLRGISQRKNEVRLGPQTLAELDQVAREFNQMAERLARQGGVLDLVLDSMTEGVIVFDMARTAIYQNHHAGEILDCKENPFELDSFSRGQTYFIESDDQERQLVPDEIPISRALQGEIIDHLEVRVAGPEGDRWLHLSAFPLRDGAQAITGAVMFAHDATHRKEIERERLLLASIVEFGADAIMISSIFPNLPQARCHSTSATSISPPPPRPRSIRWRSARTPSIWSSRYQSIPTSPESCVATPTGSARCSTTWSAMRSSSPIMAR